MMTKEKKLFKIFVLGNTLVKQDSLPIKLVSKLEKILPDIDFIPLDPSENLPKEEHLIILDTIINATKVSILTEMDIEKILPPPRNSVHDFDLAFQLKLAKKLLHIKKVTIIGIPPFIKEEKAVNDVKKEIEKIINLSLKSR